MLDRVLKYGRDQGLAPEPGFLPKFVRWAIVVSAGGEYRGLVELGETEQKKNRGRRFDKCPNLSQPEIRGGPPGTRHFLADEAGVVALYTKKTDKELAKLETKQAFFIDLLCRAAQSAPELEAAARVLADPVAVERIKADLADHKAKENDKVTFRIDGRFPLESESWHDWWRGFREELASTKTKKGKKKSGGGVMLDLVTGKQVKPEYTHKKIRGLGDVGGHPQFGDTLVSQKQPCFWSYGLPKATYAAMAEETVEAYRASFEHLIENHSKRLAGAKVVHWYKDTVPAEEDPVWFLEQAEEQAERSARRWAEELLESIRAGKKPQLTDNRYHALTLSANSGRVVVRDWMEGSFEELVENVRAWFEDLEISRWRGGGLVKSPKFERVLTGLLPIRKEGQKYESWIKPVGYARELLWKAAVRNDDISYSIISRLITVHSLFMTTGQLEEVEKNKNSRQLPIIISTLHARMALLKAYYVRQEGGDAMSPYLNPEHPSPAYHCGRLMAVLANLQRSALGDVGAGVVQRYYAAASATPGLVLGRLIRTGQFHLNKLDPGLTRWYEDRVAGIAGRIGDRIPGTLGLEEQGLFALGYYQELADLRTKKTTPEADTEAQEKEND